MKKIINRKLYDTETARKVAEREEYGPGDFKYVIETLYAKRSGAYFLHGYGNAASRYAERVDASSWRSGERIVPLTFDEAAEWAEEAMGADAWQEEFGPADEGGSKATISASVSSSAKSLLELESRRTGESQSAVLDRLIMSGLGGSR